MGLYKSTVQHIIIGSYMLLNADDKGKVNVSRTKKRTKKGRREKGVGVLDTGVSRSTCSWAPSMAQLRPRGGTTTNASGEDPHEEAPHEENNDQNC
jgi:hypothetical protein